MSAAGDVLTDALDVLKIGHPQWWMQKHPRLQWLPGMWTDARVRLRLSPAQGRVGEDKGHLRSKDESDGSGGNTAAVPTIDQQGDSRRWSFPSVEWVKKALSPELTQAAEAYRLRALTRWQLRQLRKCTTATLWKRVVRQTHHGFAEPRVTRKLTQVWLDTHAPPTVAPPGEEGDQKHDDKEKLVTKLLVEQLRKLGATTDDEALTTVQAVEELIAKHEEVSSSPELTASDYRRLRSLRHSLHRCSVEHRLNQAWQRLHPKNSGGS
jgi:hypothetical protein